MANKYYKQFLYTPHVYPVLLEGSFIVDAANGNGLGLRSLKGNGISNIYMHTSAAFTGTSHSSTLIDGIASGTATLQVGMAVQGSGIPALTTIASIVDSGSITLSAATSSSTTGSITYQAVGNPNPAAGEIVVQLSDNYNRYLGGWGGFVSPLSGSTLTTTVANVINVIVSVGTTTVAQWQALGLPKGIAPVVGTPFVANGSTAITGTGAVQLRLAAGSGIDHIEVVGDPNASLQNSLIQNPAIVQSKGGYIYMAAFKNTALTAPTDGSVIGLEFYLSNHQGGSNGAQNL